SPAPTDLSRQSPGFLVGNHRVGYLRIAVGDRIPRARDFIDPSVRHWCFLEFYHVTNRYGGSAAQDRPTSSWRGSAGTRNRHALRSPLAIEGVHQRIWCGMHWHGYGDLRRHKIHEWSVVCCAPYTQLSVYLFPHPLSLS